MLTHPRPGRPVRFGVFELDLRAGELRRCGVKLKLQDKPLALLAILLERPGEVVTREELREKLWPADTFVDFDHSLNTAINKLRDALGDTAGNPRFIETLARRGYRFMAPVQANGMPVRSADVPASAPAPAAVPAPEPELPQPHRGLVRVLFALIQVMYLVFYIVALAHLDRVHEISAEGMGAGTVVVVVAMITAVIGIPMRLYLGTAVGFDYRRLGEKFRRLFPLVFVLDEIWALSPLLLAHKIGIGLSLAASAALLYVPFSQRTLMRMGYPDLSRQPSGVSN